MTWLLVAGLVVTGVVVVVAVAVYLLGRRLQFDVELPDFSDLFLPAATDFPQTGSMPLSTRLQQSVWRLHPSVHLHVGRAFPQTFEDGPWKWDEAQRYAPEVLVSGHFFALDGGGAIAEAKYYGLDLKDRVMLEAELDLDNVLDLRWEPNIREVLSKVLTTPVPPNGLLRFLRALVHEETGGNNLTDEIGLWAQDAGYRGVLFFGARSIEQHRKGSLGSSDTQLGLPVVGAVFKELRDDPAAANLVAYSGVELVRAIRRYRTDNDVPWVANEYFGADAATIDAELDYGSDEWQERVSDTMRLAGETRLELHWDGRVEEATDDD